AVLLQLRDEMGNLRFSSQYNQRPIPLEGNLLHRSDFRFYEKLPDASYKRVVHSWDVATMTGEGNDFSVCTTWWIVGKEAYLADVWRGRLEYPALRLKVIAMAEEHRPTMILIEAAGAGTSLVQELNASNVRGMPTPLGCTP